MRHRYGYNCQVVNWGGFNELTPLGYIETVPGETISGSVNFCIRSQPTVLAVDTRAFLDVFAFYIPHRLTYEQFPDFVQAKTTTVMPFVTNLMPFNFETRFSIPNAGGTGFDRNTPFMRGAYRAVWNKFFKREDEVEMILADNVLKYASQRSSTLETRPLLGNAKLQDTQVGLSGTSPNQTLGLNTLRSAMATDRFNKMRAWYGDKYVDYLASLGVEVEWSLLMEPEVIARKSQEWRYQRTAQTSGFATPPQNTVGQMAGAFYSEVKLPIKRTFSPEHGLLCFYAVARADAVFTEPPQPPILCKIDPRSYWSPEYESIIGADRATTGLGAAWPGQLTAPTFLPGIAFADRFMWHSLQYDEYRTGMNYNRAVTNGPRYNLTVDKAAILTEDKYLNLVQASYGPNFTQAGDQQFQVVGKYHLIRNSPVRPIDLRLKLS